MIFFLGQKCSSMSQKLFINKLRYAVGKEMAINKPLSGLGWRLKLDGLFCQKCSSMSQKISINKLRYAVF